MIKQVYSRRLKRKVYRLDARPTHGKRFRKFFLRRSDAEAVAYKLKHDAIIKRFGSPTALDRPLFSDLVKSKSELALPFRLQGKMVAPLLADFWQTTFET